MVNTDEETNQSVLERKVAEQLQKLDEAVENDDMDKARAHGEEVLILIGYYND